MKIFRKVICCLVLPIIAMFGLGACGSDKSIASIQNKYSTIKTSTPDLFVIADNSESEQLADTTDVMKITYSKDSEMNKITKLTDVNLDAMGFANDHNSYKRYYALYYLQQQLLTDIFMYYDEQSENFYENYDIASVKQEELNTFYKKLEHFANEVKEFGLKKQQLEDTVDVMTFTGVVRADLTSYAYSLNMLIEESLDLIGYFKDMNTKYFYSDEITEENKIEYIRHYLCEANFELAEVCYYKYLKAFNNINECDLSGLIEINSAKKALVVQSDIWNGRLVVKSIDRTFDELNDAISSDTLDDFLEIRASFLQKTEIFKTVYESMDYYNYNNEYVKASSEEYKKTVGSVEKANIQLIELYYSTTLADYIGAVYKLKVD